MYEIPGYNDVRLYLEKHRPDDFHWWLERNKADPPRSISEIRLRALHNLAKFTDSAIIPKTTRKTASHCRGVPPGGGDKLPHAWGLRWQRRADAGNECYNALMQELITL